MARKILKKISKFKPVWFQTLSITLKVALFFILLFSMVLLWGLSQIPSDKKIKGCLTTNLYKVHLCPGTDSYVRLSQISNYLQKAVVLTEDSSFWNHEGFDLQEMQNSLKANLEKGRFARGGSTITQQLAKNLFLSKEKTLSRKILEAVITVRIEKTLSKKEILERYLNVVQFGKDIYGVKKAAQFYFSKTPENLSLAESAFLVFLLPNPEVYSKSFYKKQLTPFAQQRLNTIVDRLYQYNRVTESEYLAAKSELQYFLTGEEPIIIDPALEELNEEEVETYEDYESPIDDEG